MEDAGFIIGSYVLTFAGIGAYALFVLRRARRVTRRLPDEAKPWT
jgi:hypothetical protein